MDVQGLQQIPPANTGTVSTHVDDAAGRRCMHIDQDHSPFSHHSCPPIVKDSDAGSLLVFDFAIIEARVELRIETLLYYLSSCAQLFV
jgi:hypothetical protein